MIESHKMIRHRVRQRWIVAASSVVFVGVGLAGCGGSKTTENTLVYGLEAETDAGWCLSEGQLALSGMQIAKAIYDPLTMPDDKGDPAAVVGRAGLGDLADSVATALRAKAITQVTAQVSVLGMDNRRAVPSGCE